MKSSIDSKKNAITFPVNTKLYRLFLEVRASNLAALTLYRRAGFEQVGVRRGYYRDAQGSEDALVMACELSGKSNG